MKLALVAFAAASLVASTAAAEPTIGTALTVGESMGGQADARVGSSLHVLLPVARGWQLGGELAGTLEGYSGGYGCGTVEGSDSMTVPSVAVTCLSPSLSAHALAAVAASPSPATSLRVELGLGATAVLLVPGQGGQSERATRPSGLVRVSYLLRAGEAVEASWWIGLAAEERALGLSSPRTSAALGLVLEGRPLR